MKNDCVVRLTSVSNYGQLCRQNNLFNINGSMYRCLTKDFNLSYMGPKSFQTVQIFSIIQMFDKRLSLLLTRLKGKVRRRLSENLSKVSTQRPRIDLSKRFLPRPNTTKA